MTFFIALPIACLSLFWNSAGAAAQSEKVMIEFPDSLNRLPAYK